METEIQGSGYDGFFPEILVYYRVFNPACLSYKSGIELNSVAVVRKRTIPTDRPPLVGEVSANLCGQRVLRDQRNELPRPLISVF
jgi:hypothetical protein